MAGQTNASWHYISSLELKVQGQKKEIEAWRSGAKYAALQKELERLEKKHSREVSVLKKENCKAWNTVTKMRQEWADIFDEQTAEHEKEKEQLESIIAAKDNEIQELQTKISQLEELVQEQVEERIEAEAKAKHLDEKLQYEISKGKTDHTNSSLPSSAREFHAPIQNSREKSGKKPGAQPGHRHHPRKRREQVDRRTVLPPPQEVREHPENWVKTGRRSVKQKVELTIREETEEFISEEYRHIHTGRRVFSPWPEDLGKDEVNYGPVYKAVVLYLTHRGHMPARKVCEFLADASGGSCRMSHGMAAQLSKRFSRQTKGMREKIFETARKAAVAHADTACARVNGSQCALNLMLTSTSACYLATEHKGFEAWEQMPTARFMGVLISDGEPTFKAYGLFHQLCLAHLIRELKGVSVLEPDKTWPLKLRALLQRMIHERKTEAGLETLEKWAAKMRRDYENLCRLGVQEYNWKQLGQNEKKGASLLDRLIEREDDVLYFLNHPSVPYTNNACERGLRPVKRKTKAGVTWRSLESLRCYADFLTVTRTALLNDLELFPTLVNILRSDYMDA